MAEFSKELLDKLSEFMIRELGSKVLYGITYTLLLNNELDSVTYNEYKSIKDEAVRCGYKNNEVFRIHKVSNGYICDMDLSAAKQISNELYKVVAKNNGVSADVANNPNFKLINDSPDDFIKKDIVKLARYLKERYDKGERQIEVALFSKNTGEKININAKLQDGTNVLLQYHAYKLRLWDIETLNEKYLVPAGFRVKRIQPLEILPSKTGVTFEFTMESTSEFYANREKSV